MYPRPACLLALSLSALMTGGVKADLSTSNWSLKTHGRYIEMSEGTFLRAEAIESVKARITVRYERNHNLLLTKFFPLSAHGLSEFKRLDRSKLQNAICHAHVEVTVNGEFAGRLVSSDGSDPITDWKAFEAAAHGAREQVMTLLRMASHGN